MSKSFADAPILILDLLVLTLTMFYRQETEMNFNDVRFTLVSTIIS